jgi:hypothetical protein
MVTKKHLKCNTNMKNSVFMVHYILTYTSVYIFTHSVFVRSTYTKA